MNEHQVEIKATILLNDDNNKGIIAHSRVPLRFDAHIYSDAKLYLRQIFIMFKAWKSEEIVALRNIT